VEGHPGAAGAAGVVPFRMLCSYPSLTHVPPLRCTLGGQAAIDYWQLPQDAMWVDCLKRMLADESHHRDVNHAMASMTEEEMFGQANPFIHEHVADYEAGVKRRTEAILKRALALETQTTRTPDVLASQSKNP